MKNVYRIAGCGVFAALLWSSFVQAEPAAPAPIEAPELFAPGVISGPGGDGSPTFTPDGNTLYFTRSSATWSVILESHRLRDQWSAPQVAPFSGEWSDSSPGMAPDGSYLVFVSTRPKDPSAPAAKSVANLYRVNRQATGWSAPERLPDAVNIGPSIWKPSMASDGTIYFVSIDGKGHKRLYSSAQKDGTYQPARPLSFSDGKTDDVDPEIAPDGSFLMFASAGRLKADPKEHLFIALKTGGGWGPVRQIRYVGDDRTNNADNEPHLAPDHTTMYFSSDRSMPVAFPRTR